MTYKEDNTPKDSNTTTTTTTTTKETRLKREFILNEDVTASSVKDIILGIEEINRIDREKKAEDSSYKPETIRVIVNTYGGSVYDGFALVSVIDTSETPVHTYLYGKAMSMGFIIFASGHKRFATPLATLMYHQISTGTFDCIEGITQVVDQALNLEKAYDDYILSVSNVPKEKMEESKKYKKNWFMFAQEGLEYGLVDEIIPSQRNKNKK